MIQVFGNRNAARRPARIVRTAAAAVLAVLIGAACGCGSRKQGPPALQPPEVVLRQARALMEKKKYPKVREVLLDITQNPAATQQELAEAQLMVADAYFLDKGFLNLTEAQGRYQNFVTFNPRHERVDYAQFQLAMCYFLQVLDPDRDQDQTRKAIEEFRKLEKLYPGSTYVPQARQKITECFDRMAEHEFIVARFYMRKKAYDAALQRFGLIQESYPDYTGREKLYYYTARAYQKSGHPDRAREYFERILKDFPDGEYAKTARQALGRKGAGAGADTVPAGVDS